MVILKNDQLLLDRTNFLESILKNKRHDCILYSSEGMKFSIHKEIFFESKLMQNILKNANHCCKVLEIITPCSKNELEYIVNLLYSGRISCLKQFEMLQVQENLTKIFGFPASLFTYENPSKSNLEKGHKIEEKLEVSDEITDEKKKVEAVVSSIDIKNNTNNNSLASLSKKTYSKKSQSFSRVDIRPIEEFISHSETFNPNENKLTNSEIDPLQSDVIDFQEEKPFQCTDCGQNFDIVKCFKRHTSLDHPNQCKNCDKKFTKKIKLKRHMLFEHQEEKFQCNVCQLTFDSKPNLDLHIGYVHGKLNPNFCYICNKQYYRYLFHHENVFLYTQYSFH